MHKLLIESKPLQNIWPCHNKNTKHKHDYTTLDIILYATRPTKYNQSKCTQKLQSINNCKNLISLIGKNPHRYRNETQICNNGQRKISTVIELHYHWCTWNSTAKFFKAVHIHSTHNSDHQKFFQQTRYVMGTHLSPSTSPFW